MAQSLQPWVKAQCSRKRSAGLGKKDVRDVVKVLKFVMVEFAKERRFDWPQAIKEYEDEVKEKLVASMK